MSADQETFRNADSVESVVQLRPADLTPHPANPRRHLGELSELAASIAAHGLLEPVVALPVALVAAAWPRHAADLAHAQWVVLLGHRRVVAASDAGLDTVPVLIRRDLGTAEGQLSAMTAENVARASLSPLEEAAAFAELAERGWSQRRIAATLGTTQSQVSKRLKLLRLPDQLQSAIIAGELAVSDALVISDLDHHDQMHAAWTFYQQHPYWRIDQAIQHQREQARRQDRRRASLERAVAEGVEVVDPGQRFGDQLHNHRLHNRRAVTAARRDGTLVYGLSWDQALIPYSTKPTSITATIVHEDQVTEERERQQARRAREEACARLIAAPPSDDRLRDMLARAILTQHDDRANLARAARLLSLAGVGPTIDDPWRWRTAMVETSDTRLRARAAWALLVAADEAKAHATHRSWDADTVAYLARLRSVGYVPTPWEQARLAASMEQSSSRTRQGHPPVR